MSSIPEKSSTSASIVEKRGFFLRTSSIQKIKCSATYPFRLAGTKFSKDAIKQLFETLVIKSRLFSQRALLDLLIATFKLIGVLASLWVGTPAKDVCDKTKKTETILGFHERLLEKIHKLQKHKQRFEVKPKDLSSSSSPSSPLLSEVSSKFNNEQKSSTEFQAELKKLRKISSEKIEHGKSDIYSGPSEKTTNDDQQQKKNYLLVVLVYSSITFIYLQLLILTVALSAAQNFPPGLLFLITSLFLIAAIIFKVFMAEKSDKCEIKFKGGRQIEKRASNLNLNAEIPLSASSVSSSSTAVSRQTRSKSRKTPVIELNGKTLSKIKIL